MTLARSTADEQTLTGEQFAIVAAFADAPPPALIACNETDFGKLMAQLAATLAMRKSREAEGAFKLKVYQRMLGHLPFEVMQRVVRQALGECEWMPTPAAMLKMAEGAMTADKTAHIRARYLVGERRHREAKALMQSIEDRSFAGELDDLAPRMIDAAIARGFIFRRRDGKHVYRTAEALAENDADMAIAIEAQS